jgi:hypothetical protein
VLPKCCTARPLCALILERIHSVPGALPLLPAHQREMSHQSHLPESVARGMQDYEARKAADPEFYRSADTLSYGKAAKDSDAAIDRMVAELEDRCRLLPQCC